MYMYTYKQCLCVFSVHVFVLHVIAKKTDNYAND